MSPEQLKVLAKLSKQFDEGGVSLQQVKQLSSLLDDMKQRQGTLKEQYNSRKLPFFRER